MHTWRETVRDCDEENQFQSPKDSRYRRSPNINVALRLWNLEGDSIKNNKQTNAMESRGIINCEAEEQENTRGEDHPVLSTINSCSFFFWSWKICFFVDRPSDQPFHFSFLPSVLASNFWCCDGSCPGTCHKLNITIYKRIQTSLLTKQEKTHRLRKQT